jgi:N utilization substance protein A
MQDVAGAIKQICDEKGLDPDAVLATVESALAAAYRKDFGQKNQNIKVEFSPESGKTKIYDLKTVVEDMPEEDEEESEQAEGGETEEKKEEPREDAGAKGGETPEDEEEEKRKFNPKTEIQLTDAKEIKKTAKVGDEIKTKLDVPEGYGRMAAQTAKQVIIQKLREAEREMIFNEFKDKEGEVVSGVVQRMEGRTALIDLGKIAGILPPEEQIPGERYRAGERIKVYVREVNLKPKGPEVLLSRTSEEILKKVFYLEIPEIANGLIEIKGVAREAGNRSKIAIASNSDNIDPIGSCVGQRGSRIQTIINELGGEKVDIIEFDENPVTFISKALSPAKVIGVELNEESGKATVTVAPDQFSLAIGKGGQNARLAARLSDWKIDIVEAKEEGEGKEFDSETEEIKGGDDESLPGTELEGIDDDAKAAAETEAKEGVGAAEADTNKEISETPEAPESAESETKESGEAKDSEADEKNGKK